MNRQEANEQYQKSLKLGQKKHKELVLRGKYPYPQVLDEVLDDTMVSGWVEMGVLEIPTEQIVGTKTAGRRSAFAANFMPLLGADTEFAQKWMALCAAHLGDEGIREPIRCYEYLGRFYVQEGNKRVSVLKSYGAPTIPGYVIRVVPKWSEDQEVRAYYDFMASYRMTGLYRVYFSRPGSFAKLQAALGFEPDHQWTPDERQHFVAGLTYFRDALRKQTGGEDLPVTSADALLVWLRVYKFEQLWSLSASELAKSVAAVWPDIKLSAVAAPISVSTETEEQKSDEDAPPPNLFGRLLHAVFPDHLNVAFVNEYNPENSTWVRAHDLGREYLEAMMGDKVTVKAYYDVGTGEAAAETMIKAVEDGAQVVFATSPPLIAACRTLAAKYPGVRVLNCSASMPYAGVRTYYSRIYEGKFITGAIAGAMSRDGEIGYVASNPIFGVPASINAFALGSRLTNPRSRIKLRWSCVEENAMGALAAEGVEFISNRDVPTPDRVKEPWGLCQVQPDGTLHSLASPYWHWGSFYVKLVRSIFSGGWDELNVQDEERAVNYWWGMSSRAVDLLLSEKLPSGVAQLVQILRKGVTDGSIEPFRRPIHSQDGQVRNDGEKWFSPEEILHMDWLCDCVDGEIPSYDQLLPVARPLVRLQGVYREQIPPEKEGANAVKILLVSDKESPYYWDYYQPGRLDDIDLIIACGDLKSQYLSFLVTMGHARVLYVHGNHDQTYERRPPEGCDCIENKLVTVNGVRILGLGGCPVYSGGPHQYTERQMARRIRKTRFKLWRAKGVDIVVTHSPAKGYGDGEDYAHRGFECFLPFLDKYQPKYLVHGHVHLNYGADRPRTLQRGETTIINAYERYILEIPDR